MEDLTYVDILSRAASCSSSLERMVHVCAFSSSSYASTSYRTSKPFNPLLGETYELDRRAELGWRAFCEQVGMPLCVCVCACECVCVIFPLLEYIIECCDCKVTCESKSYVVMSQHTLASHSYSVLPLSLSLPSLPPLSLPPPSH